MGSNDGYLYAFEHLIPNRHAWATMVLELLPLAAWLMAIGTLIARPWSWWLVIAGGTTMLAWTVTVLFVLLYTASYLAGVYGAFGKAASSGALGAMALSLGLELAGRSRASNFVGKWPTPLLLLGVYNKLVKTLGTR